MTDLRSIDLGVDPVARRHWRVATDGPVATVTMDVAPDGGLRADYSLKLNSYDLSVDVELFDIVQRLRFEHPEVKAVVLTGAIEKVFCAGANIQMLSGATHEHKVNFCKFTNETRNAIEDASARSAQTWIAAVNGTAAGGGYELALACDEVLLVDDRSSAVSLPEVPLLAVLPGTGGVTRLVDKRLVRRDLADVFATRTEGVKGQQAVAWGLVDAVAPRSEFGALVESRALARAAESDRPDAGPGISLPIFGSTTVAGADTLRSRYVDVDIDRDTRSATVVVRGPEFGEPSSADDLLAAGARAWILCVALELDHALLHLRFNEPTVGTWVLETSGDPEAVRRAEHMLFAGGEHWLLREVRLLWARTLKRLDLSSRTIFALVQQGSCFTGVLAELMLAADRSIMLDGVRTGDDRPASVIRLTASNLDAYPMSNGLSRLHSRFWGRERALAAAVELLDVDLSATDASEAELVTFALDEIDWDDEVRVMLEERSGFSPDALTGLEANLRFVGPETLETKIFGRLSAWQNWIFQRANAVGPHGALHTFGTGVRPTYDETRV